MLRGLAIALGGLVLAGCERVSQQYASRAEAEAAGAIEAGWVPTFTPASARRIREIHDLDTNDVCVRFELPTSKAQSEFVASMRPLSDDEIEGLSETCRLGPSWWFEGLIQHQPSNNAALHALLYEAPLGAWKTRALIAVDRGSTSVYVWSR
jgi:hypothetical protein